MSRFSRFLAAILMFSSAAFAATGPDGSIGVVTMRADRTILIGVSNSDGARADAVLMLEPGDTNYQPIIDHVGGLSPGQTKPIPPWPENPPKQESSPPAAEKPPG